MIFKILRKFLYSKFNLSLSKLPPKKSIIVCQGIKINELEALKEKNYKFYFVCFGEKSDSLYWLNDWLSIFLEFNVQFLVVLRSEELQSWIFENYPDVNSVTINGFQQVVELHKATINTSLALYPINSMHNHLFVRLTKLRHVFIGHGDSDKLSSANKVLRMFDEVWCSGQAQVDRFLNQDFNCSSLRLRKVGRPGLKKLLSVREKTVKEQRKFLYLPTWEGSDERWDYSSISNLENIVDAVLADGKASIGIRLHPFIGRRSKALLEKVKQVKNKYSSNTRVEFSSTEVPLVKVLNDYSYFICDVSSVVTECLAVNHPIFLYQSEHFNIETAESNIPLSSFCYTFKSANELSDKVSVVLGGDDYKADRRFDAADYFIGIQETKNEMLKKLLSEQVILD